MDALETVTLSGFGAGSAVISKHGGHLIKWSMNAASKGQDILFTSTQSLFAPPKAIRGGVPICFPQFGKLGPMAQQHGFARNTPFEIEAQSPSAITMLLKYDGTGYPEYPHPFEIRTTVTLDDKTPLLTQDLCVKNTGSHPLSFTCALHTYYKIASIDSVDIAGLKGVEYMDNLQGMKKSVEDQEGVKFPGEVDRIYLGAPDVLEIKEHGIGRTIKVAKHGFPDAVVWNPWIDKSKGMSDFGDEEYKVMLCIEPAVAGSGPVVLEPGATWTGSQAISVHD